MVSTVDDVLTSSVRVDSIVSMSSEDASVDVTLGNVRLDTLLMLHLFIKHFKNSRQPWPKLVKKYL